MRYRSRPTEIDAIQWNGVNWDKVYDFVNDPERAASTAHYDDDPQRVRLDGKDVCSAAGRVAASNAISHNT